MTQETTVTPRHAGEPSKHAPEHKGSVPSAVRRHAKYARAALVVSSAVGVSWMHWQHLQDFVLHQSPLISIPAVLATVSVTAREVPIVCRGLVLLLLLGAARIRKLGNWSGWSKMGLEADS